jgi:hypothetical protein
MIFGTFLIVMLGFEYICNEFDTSLRFINITHNSGNKKQEKRKKNSVLILKSIIIFIVIVINIIILLLKIFFDRLKKCLSTTNLNS